MFGDSFSSFNFVLLTSGSCGNACRFNPFIVRLQCIIIKSTIWKHWWWKIVWGPSNQNLYSNDHYCSFSFSFIVVRFFLLSTWRVFSFFCIVFCLICWRHYSSLFRSFSQKRPPCDKNTEKWQISKLTLAPKHPNK